MITAHLKGGLGNQMFQIAAAYSLALDNGDECAFYFGNPNINQGNPARYYVANVFRELIELSEDLVIKPNYSEVRYMEPRFNYDPILYREGIVLQGFFQSEKYFKHHRKEIIKLFKHEDLIPQGNYENSVSIHVRRGDYLDPFMSQFIPAQSMDYYNRALAYVESRTKIDHILIFSDDIQWCKANFNDPRMIFIEGQLDYIDMYMMTKCNHNIIANSSFSWWGTWLNENENKIVCAPFRWFGDAFKEDWQDIYCENWITI
jgi:hypothetical protein